MRRAAEDLLQAAAVELQAGLSGVELLYSLRSQRQQLVGKPRASAGGLDAEGLDLSLEVLVGGVARVLVALARGVVVELAERYVAFVVKLQEGEQLPRTCQRALEGRQLLGECLGALELGEEGPIAFEDARKVPGVVLGDVCAFHALLLSGGSMGQWGQSPLSHAVLAIRCRSPTCGPRVPGARPALRRRAPARLR